jgi:DNA repair protein RadA/Sms
MAKVKTSFFCQNCGMESPQWVGKCSSCNEWNTLIEEVIEKSSKAKIPFSSNSDK